MQHACDSSAAQVAVELRGLLLLIVGLSSALRLWIAFGPVGFLTGDDVEVIEAAFAPVTGLVYAPWSIRSLLIPLTAAVMNLLAAGAAFGVVTLVFQKGFLAGPLGVGTGPIEAFLPVMMLAILFGLSMDYQVFLVSRMHEEWVHRRDNGDAVRIGQADTGRVITAAASIMILIFLSFIFQGQRVISEFGIGEAWRCCRSVRSKPCVGDCLELVNFVHRTHLEQSIGSLGHRMRKGSGLLYWK